MEDRSRVGDIYRVEDRVRIDYRLDKIGYIGAYDRPKRPTFLSLELDAINIEIEVAPFVDVVTHFPKRDALP